MSPPLRSLTFALCSLFLCERALAEQVQADASSSDGAASSAEARSRYEAGVHAYAAGRYADAVEQFHEADLRAPSAALSFDIARAYTKLGDDAGALAAYREYLRRAQNPDDEEVVQRTVKSLSLRLAARGIQQVTILSTPPGATAFLDGERVGVTPVTSETKPGVHSLTVSREGYAEESRSVTVPLNDAIDIRVSLREKTQPPHAAQAAPVTTAKPLSPRAARSSPPPRDSTPARPLRTIGIVALGAGGAALGGALAFELLRRDAEQKAKGEQEQVSLANEMDTIHARRTDARVLVGVGAGLAAIGGALFFLSPNPSPSGDHGTGVKLDATTTRLGATVSGRF